MVRKPKLELKITRIKLNPEQAVLACSCYSGGLRHNTALHAMQFSFATWCSGRSTVTGRWWGGSGTLS